MATRITEATEIQALPPMFAPGSVLLGRYQIEALLGTGACGLVLRARDHALDQAVAIKILRGDVASPRNMEARLMREARAITQLRSDHVVRVFDVGTLGDGVPFLVMELLYGIDLAELLVRHRAIAPAIAVDFVLQACDALAEAHAFGVVHRDIKPSNLFVVARPDGSELVKVLDFGISKSPMLEGDPSLTRTASLLGTPAYMSPEQMRSARTVDARSDLWALGTVLYELVEGRLPITASSFAEHVLLASTQPHEPMTVAPQLAGVIARCLAKVPDERYANVAELAAALAPFTTGSLGLACVARTARVLGVAAPSAMAGPAGAPRSRRSPRPLVIAGALVAVLAIPTLVVATRGGDRVPATRADRSPPAAVRPALRVAPARSAPVAPMIDPAAARASSSVDAGRPAAATPAEPPAVVLARPPSSPKPAKSPARRKPSAAGSGAACDPYARPKGC